MKTLNNWFLVYFIFLHRIDLPNETKTRRRLCGYIDMPNANTHGYTRVKALPYPHYSGKEQAKEQRQHAVNPQG